MDDLTRAGLAVKNYDRFRNRIMFPLANGRGQVVGFAGRVMPGASEKREGEICKHSGDGDLSQRASCCMVGRNPGGDKNAGWVVVVEGEIDVIASWQAGVKT